MGFIQKLTPLLPLLILSGCATIPPGPSVNVQPASNKPPAVFQNEDASCRRWAEEQLGASPQAGDSSVATGAVVGTAVGAGVGAVVGSGVGALIGAAGGLFVGSLAGSSSDQGYGPETQLRYDSAYVQCMSSYGNQVPGYRPQVEAAPPRPVAQAHLPPVMTPAIVPPPPDAPPAPPNLSPEPGPYAALPAEPEDYAEKAPQFIYAPALNLYVAAGVPYDLVYAEGGYFYNYRGLWYRGPYYNGPWTLATRRYFPQVLLRFRTDAIRHYRDLEFNRFTHDRAHYNGRLFRPKYRRRKARYN